MTEAVAGSLRDRRPPGSVPHEVRDLALRPAPPAHLFGETRYAAQRWRRKWRVIGPMNRAAYCPCVILDLLIRHAVGSTMALTEVQH